MVDKRQFTLSFTTKEVEALKPKDKPYLVRVKQENKNDGVLAFKVLTTGEIDAYFIYFADGKEKRKKIGRYPVKTVKAIRDRYRKLSSEYQGGIDIKAQELEQESEKMRQLKEQADNERRLAMQGSFQQLIDMFVEHLRADRSKHYYLAVNRAFKAELKDFDMTIKANAITKRDINLILNGIIKRESLIMANRMRTYLMTAFNWAIKYDDPDDATKAVQFCIDSNPVAGVKKPKEYESPTERFLSEDEVFRFWQALDSSSMSIHRANVYKLMLATGARVEAISGLQWSEIDFKDRLMTIPPARSKNGLHWVIPLDNIAYEILTNNPRTNDVFLFPAPSGIEPLRTDGFNQAIGRLCKQIGMDHFTPKDLRTTFKTLAGKKGIAKDIRDRLQNHALTDVSSKHYDRYDYLNEKRAAMELWNQALTKIINNEFKEDQMTGANVVPFKAKSG